MLKQFPGPLLSHVISKGGQQMLDELNSLIQANRLVNVIVTKGYSLSCKNVVHLRLTDDFNADKATIIEAFQQLVRLNAKSVALHAFGG